MFEHVGQEFIPVFMQKLDQLLKKGGLGLLHTIGKDKPSASDPWMWKYIFPGNHLPTPNEIAREMGVAGFSLLDVENLRLHYARTWICGRTTSNAMLKKCARCLVTLSSACGACICALLRRDSNMESCAYSRCSLRKD